MEEVETPVVQAIFACSQIALQAFFAPREQKNDGIKQPKNKKPKVAVAADLSKPIPIPVVKFDTRVKEWFDSFDEQAKEGHIGKAPSPLQKVLIFCSLFIFIDFVVLGLHVKETTDLGRVCDQRGLHICFAF